MHPYLHREEVSVNKKNTMTRVSLNQKYLLLSYRSKVKENCYFRQPPGFLETKAYSVYLHNLVLVICITFRPEEV